LEVARNTVRRYLRGARAEVQGHLAARRLDEAARAEALRLYDGEAEGNAVVVARLLREQSIAASVRTVQRRGRRAPPQPARVSGGDGAVRDRARRAECRSTLASAW